MIRWVQQSKNRFSQIVAHRKGSAGYAVLDTTVSKREVLSTPMNEAKYAVIDTELSGLDYRKDAIISIGGVRMVGGKIYVGDAFYRLVNPGAEFNTLNVTIHGITPSDLKEKPGIESVLPEFIDFCGNDVIIGFYPSIDLAFLNREMSKIYGLSIKNLVVDVFVLYRWIRHKAGDGHVGNPSLYGIAQDLGIPVRDAHNAISDAFITAQVFQRLLYALSDLGIRSVGELVNISNPLKGGDRLRFASRINNL